MGVHPFCGEQHALSLRLVFIALMAKPLSAFETLSRDLSYCVRRLYQSPVFALVTVLTLALGIGANATIFSIVSKFVLRPAPVGDPATLVAIHTTHRAECCNSFSWPLFNDLREQAHSFSGISAYYDLVPASIGGRGEPVRMWGQAATANFFDVTKLRMTLGRGFRSGEEHTPVVVLGYRLWMQRFGGDPAIAGKAINLSGKPFTVVGVAPPGFRGVDLVLDAQFWVPLGNLQALLPNTGSYTARNYHWLTAIGRMKPAVTQTEVRAELDLLAKRILATHPEGDADGFRFEEAGSLPPRDKSAVLMFLGALSLTALMVLGVAGVNVANLFLGQAAKRQREMAVRLALGASRGHLLQQWLTESVLLALAGGSLGVALSLAATRSLSAFRFPAPVPLDLTVAVDGRVLLYSFLLSFATGVLFGLAPAWTVVRPLLALGIAGRSMVTRPRRIWSLSNLLVVAQIALSVVLLCSTGLFLRSLESASRIEIGFRSEGVLMMAVDPRLHGYSPERTTQFLNELRERVAGLPGVQSATYTDSIPLSGGHRSDGFYAEGQSAAERQSAPSVEMYMIGPDYFDTIGTSFVAGRPFAHENPNGPKVAVVNEALVAKLFKNENPIGRRVIDQGVPYLITGVVKNVKSRFLGEDYRPVLYRSLAQDIASDPSFSGYRIVVHFNRDGAGVAHAVRTEIHTLDPTLAIFDEATMREHLRDALFLPRLAGALFGTFGLVGLSLAAVGLYGVINSWVNRRTREIGIRMALGARVGQVQWLVVRRGMILTLAALVPGLAMAFAVSKLFRSVLYGVQPHDVVTFTFAPVVFSLRCGGGFVDSGTKGSGGGAFGVAAG